jgi:hypothetical protein
VAKTMGHISGLVPHLIPGGGPPVVHRWHDCYDSAWRGGDCESKISTTLLWEYVKVADQFP